MINIKSIAYASLFVAGAVACTSCEDVFEPAIDNKKTMDLVTTNATYMGGVLGYAYAILPYETKSTSDVATDDAISNDAGNSYLKMTQSWDAINSPISFWTKGLATINNLNIFMDNMGDVEWCNDEMANKLYDERMLGEALALRALNGYFLLKYHAGKDANGAFKGYPISTKAIGNKDGDYNFERNTVKECVAQIMEDLDKAMEILPAAWVKINLNDPDAVPERYKAMGANAYQYDKAFGEYLSGRICGNICMAIKSQVLMLVTSPALEGSTDYKPEDAAKAAADVLKQVGGVDGMDPNGFYWYTNKDELKKIENGWCPQEILWRGDKDDSKEDYALGLSQEKDNFPPTLNGSGRINPSQNLVDAFGMANGLPISEATSGYDEANPYNSRDPRLDYYVVFDGGKIGSTAIETGSYSSTDNGFSKKDKSTKTGYYLKKLLHPDVRIPNSGDPTPMVHYHARIRFTEIFLNYAEAANEAWGPKGDGGNGYSAYDVIKAIRKRAGIAAGGTDQYLESCAASTEDMRALIRNERRIELCFENQRFFDLRRWNDIKSINQVVYGVNITKSGNDKVYNKVQVNTPQFKDFQINCPIPDSEIRKWSNLTQNQGWGE